MTVNSSGMAQQRYLTNFALEGTIRNRFNLNVSKRTIKLSSKVMVFFQVSEQRGWPLQLFRRQSQLFVGTL